MKPLIQSFELTSTELDVASLLAPEQRALILTLRQDAMEQIATMIFADKEEAYKQIMFLQGQIKVLNDLLDRSGQVEQAYFPTLA
jgi:hypothetical protein